MGELSIPNMNRTRRNSAPAVPFLSERGTLDAVSDGGTHSVAWASLPAEWVKFGSEKSDSHSGCSPVAEESPQVSRGSAGHASGSCKPCAWFWRPGSCSNGSNCLFCHSCDDQAIERAKRERRHGRRVAKKTAKIE